MLETPGHTEDSISLAVLDVRGVTEVSEGMVPGARHAFLGELPEGLDGLDRDRPVTTMCAWEEAGYETCS